MGGFSFVFGFLLVCVGAVFVRTSATNAAMLVLGACLVGAGAIMCGAGVIAVAIERMAGTCGPSSAPKPKETKTD